MTRDEILMALADGPKSSGELGVSVDVLREMERMGELAIDPDRWPDEYVPGNPLIARLRDDERAWPGWKGWNV